MAKRPTENRYKTPSLTHKELISLMAMRTRTSEKVVSKLYKALADYIIEELKITGVVRLQWLGVFYSYMTEAGVRKVPNAEGKRVDVYCPSRRKVAFTPSESFKENLNEEIGTNTLKTLSERHKSGELIEKDTPLKAIREVAVNNMIKDVVEKQKKILSADNIEVDDIELDMDEDEMSLDEY